MTRIDHVELFVPDRREAAEWYRRVLGLTVVPAYEHWASDPRGPLMIACNGDSTKLVTPELVADHDAAWSICFCDPYGHRLEVTTYDYEQVKAALSTR